MKPLSDRTAEYAAAAKAWRVYCAKRGKDATLDGLQLPGQPIAVVILAALAEPAHLSDTFKGDLIADALGGLRTFVQHLDLDASEGGGGGAFLNGYQIETIARRLDAVLTLRGYEQGYDVSEFLDEEDTDDGEDEKEGCDDGAC